MLKDGVFGMDAFESPSSAASQGESPDNRLTRRTIFILLVYGVTILGANLGGRVLTYHETLFAQPAREMIQSGDWIVPTMCGVPSCHKPPVTYWTIAVAMAMFGSDSEIVVRLPILAATLAVALLVAWLTARWHGNRAGLWAGMVQLSCFYVLMQGRLAESDMLFCLAISAAMVLFASSVLTASVSNPGRWRAWLFYGLVGIAFLIKGPLGVALIGWGVLLFVAWQRHARGFWFLMSPVGWIIALAVGLSWPFAAYLQHPGIVDDWYMHNIGRFNGDIGGQKPPFFYFYTTPLLLLPWTPFAFAGLRLLWSEDKQEHTRSRLLACWFLAGFALLSLSAWKHKHYLIPLLPPLSVFAGYAMARFQLQSPSSWLRNRSAVLAGLLVVSGLVGAAACWQIRPDLAGQLSLLIAFIVIGLAVVLWLEKKGSRSPQPAVLFATTWLIAVGVHFLVMPAFDSYRDQTLFASKVNAQVGDQTLQIVALPENQIVYYLDSPMVREDDPKTFAEQIAQSQQPVLVLGPKYLAEELSGVASVQVLEQSPTIRKIMTERERITLLRIEPHPAAELPTVGARKPNSLTR